MSERRSACNSLPGQGQGRTKGSLQYSFAIPHLNYTEHKSSRWIIDNSRVILCLLHLLREEPHAEFGFSFDNFSPRAKEKLRCRCFMIRATHIPAIQGIYNLICKWEGLFWSGTSLLIFFVFRLTTFLMMSHFPVQRPELWLLANKCCVENQMCVWIMIRP